MLMRWRAACIALAAGSAAAMAGPLNVGWVPQQARWVVHVDVEGGVASTLGRLAMEHRDVWHHRGCGSFVARTGIDPATAIKGITIYGTSCDDADAVAIIAATSATDAFLDQLRAEEESFERIEVGDLQLDSWKEHGAQRYGYTRKDGDDRLVMVSRDKGSLVRAIGLVGGARSEPCPALSRAPREGSILFVAATDVGETAQESSAVMVRKMQDLRLDAGESGGRIFGDMLVTAATERDAANMRQMMEGAVSWGRMLAQREADLGPLITASEGLVFSTLGRDIRAEFSHDAQEAAGILKSLLESRAKSADPAAPAATTPPGAPAATPHANGSTR